MTQTFKTYSKFLYLCVDDRSKKFTDRPKNISTKFHTIFHKFKRKKFFLNNSVFYQIISENFNKFL